MFELIIGQRRNVFGVEELVRAIRQLEPNGTLYIGYPIIATADEPIVIEALLTCKEFGVVLFDLSSVGDANLHAHDIEERQNDLHTALYQKLLAFKPLRAGRSLSVSIEVVTLAPPPARARTSDGTPFVVTADDLPSLLETFSSITDEQLRLINAAIQRITTIKPSNKRRTVTRGDSRGAIMQQIDREIANLDQWQKRAAIESPDGPQRVRGLAGSGKTVVLALKAAYLHAQNPDWDIAVTFHTRALKQQFQDLIRRFSFEHLNDEPDWNKLRILHSWGSANAAGIYSEIAGKNGQSIRDFGSAKLAYGYEGAFEGVCQELLDALKTRKPALLFDAVLIDEAQDLPQPFFELAYLSTRDPKRLVWGYDELQNLSSTMMAPPAQLFGTDAAGRPHVQDLATGEDEPRRDIILPVCYRNTPWALTIAHAVGFGIYRKPGGLIQYFDDPGLWSDVGYQVVTGKLELGQEVVLERKPNSYPEYFKKLLNPDDAVESHVFESKDEQASWVADAIAHNVADDELDLSDILIVLSNPLTARVEAARVIDALNKHSIPGHLAGVTTSVDKLFQDNSVAISGIYRAKGNEAAMVYILDSDYSQLGAGAGLIRRRNILFTAITRSRAWVRICGTGTAMESLQREIMETKGHEYQLAFKVPTEPELARLRKIQRDISKRDRALIDQTERGIEQLLESIKEGKLDVETLPEDLRNKLALLMGLYDGE